MRTWSTLALSLLCVCLSGAPLAAQPSSDQDTASIAAPRMPEAPREFKLAATLGLLRWGEDAERAELDDGVLAGLEIERALADFLSLRASGAYGRTTVVGDGARLDLNQYVVELALLGRLAVGPLADAGVVPLAGVVGGSVIHDPTDADSRTRSQTALGFLAGAEIRIATRLGAHLDWRHLSVELEDVFEPQNRNAVSVGADRISAGLFWRF